jgi:iron complex transport system permease protein
LTTERSQTTGTGWLLPSVLAVGLVLVAATSLAMGAVGVAPGEVLSVVVRRLGFGGFAEPSRQADAVVWGIRLPRVLLGMTAGAVLAVVGAVMQGLFRNELADPQLLGIGPGAAVGAAIGSAAGGVQGAIAGGVVAGVITAAVLRRLARPLSIDPTRIILSGVALGLALSAWVGFVVFGSDRSAVPPIDFWLLGSLTAATWRALWTVAVPGAAACVAMIASWRILDLMALGDPEARHLGVDTDLVRTSLLIASGAAVGATVGAIGVVAFVGLLVPFLVRRASGPSHRRLLPSALVGGALFVVAADLVARIALQPVEVPIGLVTAAAGGPLFLWMISRRRDV